MGLTNFEKIYGNSQQWTNSGETAKYGTGGATGKTCNTPGGKCTGTSGTKKTGGNVPGGLMAMSE